VKKQVIITLAVFLMGITLCGAVSATDNPDDVKYVSNTGNDDNNGNETNPYLTIGKGITSVNPNGTVYVADGTYYEHLSISKNVNLVGQSQENTILDGNNTGRPITINTGANVSINLFTIRNGKVSDPGSYGGGIRNEGNLTVIASTIVNNTSYYCGGGGIYNNYGTLVVSDSVVSGNTAYLGLGGGGIWNTGNLIVSNSTISDNKALSGGYTYGGAIFNTGSVSVTDGNFTGNYAAYGGAIFNDYGSVSVTDGSFTGNTATDVGGGTYNKGTATFSGSTISGNTANYAGGIYNDGNLTVSGSTISGNTAWFNGGGIYNQGGNLTVNFNRIINNSPKNIYSDGGSADAKYNWWGSNNPDFTTLIEGNVNYNPWLYMTFQANPTNIPQGEDSNLTASFNNAFDGTTVTPLNPADGHIPDKTLVTFNTDLGSVGSKTINKETINGVATATLTADETPGIAHVNAVTDSQTVNTNVNSKLSTNTTTENKNNIAGQNVELKAGIMLMRAKFVSRLMVVLLTPLMW